MCANVELQKQPFNSLASLTYASRINSPNRQTQEVATTGPTNDLPSNIVTGSPLKLQIWRTFTRPNDSEGLKQNNLKVTPLPPPLSRVL